MAREKNGDSVKGIKRNAPFRCVAVKRRESVCTLGMRCNKKEKKKTYGQREWEIR